MTSTLFLQLFIALFLCHNLYSADSIFLADESVAKSSREIKGVVSSTFQIKLDAFPEAFNPSIIDTDEGYLLTFRYLADPEKLWISYTGIVLLDHSFKQISLVQLLDARGENSLVPSQTEDARIFSYRGDLYITYNDNPKVINTSKKDRRDIYIAKLSYSNNRFSLSTPLKLINPVKYKKNLWEKNWIPLVWNDQLFMSYSINPHEVLLVDMESGICSPCFCTTPSISWKWGTMRGGTPPLMVDGEYLAFFHSAMEMVSGATGNNTKMWHYFMGAYTFSSEPPFGLKKTSPLPINEKAFYLVSDSPKKVIYPGGYVISGSTIYLAYGKDDTEMWIAVINKDKLMGSLRAAKK